MKNLLSDRFKSAAKGKKSFLKILKKFSLFKDKKLAYLIFPEKDAEINHYAFLYLDDFLLRFGYDSAVIVTSERNIDENELKLSDKIIEVLNFSRVQIQNLIDYYSMNPAMKDVRIVSLDKPSGRRGTNLLNRKGLSVEQMIAIGVYFLLPFEKINSDFRREK